MTGGNRSVAGSSRGPNSSIGVPVDYAHSASHALTRSVSGAASEAGELVKRTVWEPPEALVEEEPIPTQHWDTYACEPPLPTSSSRDPVSSRLFPHALLCPPECVA